MKPALFNHIRTHYKTMQGYSSAGMEAGKSPDNIYLNANENPYELEGLEGLNRYPEPQPLALREAFAQNYGVDNDQLLITRGADEAIVMLTKVFCEPHQDAILINTPTFGMYSVDAHAMPAAVIDVPLLKQDGTFTLDAETITAKAKDPALNVKLIFLCSPNNPTGDSFSHETISEICEAVEDHAVVILDETYAEFSKQGSMVDDLASTPNLIILRTLSKSYAFAGMRVGCMLCDDREFIRLMQGKAMDAYPIPRLSIEAAFHVLSPEITEIAKANIAKILAERDRVQPLWAQHDKVTHVFPSDANFLLIEMENAAAFVAHCAANHVIIRDFSTKPDTQNCIRLSIGLPAENDRVLALLDTFTA